MAEKILLVGKYKAFMREAMIIQMDSIECSQASLSFN